MVYTVTFSPALDYVVGVEQFQMGGTNRTAYEKLLPGGKGLNVSRVLTNLGVKSLALGFVAGFTGAEIVRMAAEAGVRTDFVQTPGRSRINVKLKLDPGASGGGPRGETEINARGQDVPPRSVELLLEKLDAVPSGSVLVLAGSVPPSLPPDMYRRILSRTEGNVRAVVDAAGQLLLNTLPYRPFLIKPNSSELAELFGEPADTLESILRAGRKLRERGARNVLVSRGGEGAVLLAETGQAMALPAPCGTLVNSVGAGDSMVAGFLAGFLSGEELSQALRWGVAAGSASAFSEELATRSEVERLLRRIPMPQIL